jgi:hypothetical protein
MPFDTGIVISVDSRQAQQGASEVSRALQGIGTSAETASRKVDDVKARIEALAGIRDSTRDRAADIKAYGEELDRLRAKFNPLFAASQQYKQTLAEIAQAQRLGAVSNVEAAAAVQRTKDAFAAQVISIRNAANASNAHAGAVRLQGFQIANLGQQIQDVGVQLSMGTNPFIILAQQGPQITSAMGGVRNAVMLLWMALAANPVAALGVAITAAAGSLLAFTDDTVDATKAEEMYADALKLSNDALLTAEERSNRTADARNREARAAVDATIKIKQLQLSQIDSRLEASGIETGMVAGPGAEPAVNPKLKAQRDQIANELAILQQQRQQLAGGAVEDYARVASALEPVIDATNNYVKALTAVAEARLADRITPEEAAARIRQIENEYTKEKERIDGTAQSIKSKVAEEAKFWAENDRGIQMGLDGLEKLEEKRRKMIQSLSQYIKKIEEEAKIVGESKEDQEVIRAIIEAQNKLYDEQGKKIRDITDEERKRIEGAVRDRQRIEKENRDIERAKREAEREADKIRQQQEHAVEQSTDRLVDFAGDAIFDRLSGRTKSFWETFRDFGLRAIAQLAAEMAVRPLVMPIVASVVGGVGGSPVGGSGGLLGGGGGFGDILSLGSNLFGGGGLGSGGSLLSGMGVSGFGSGMGFLGAGGIGLGIGGLIGSFSPFGKTGYGGMIGGGIGGLAGFALGGPIGAVVGSVLGGLGGSLFGPGKSVGPGANANLILQNGQFAVGGSAADNGGNVSQAIQTTQQLAQALNSLVGAAGLKTAGSGFQLDAGYFQDQLFLGAGGGPGVNTLLQTSDPDALAMAAFRQLYGRGNIYGATGSVATVLANSQATTLSGLASDLDFAKQIDTLITDGPTLADSLKQITDQFEQMRSRAQALGIDLTKFDQAQQKATENFFKNALGGIDAFRTSLLTSDLSPLNPLGKITEAQSLFNETLKKAQAGDIAAINALPGVGQSLLGLGRQYYASGSGYQDLFRGVNEGLGTVLSANSGGRDLAMVFQTSTQDIVDAQNATIQELGAKLDDLKKEMRNLVLAYKAA